MEQIQYKIKDRVIYKPYMKKGEIIGFPNDGGGGVKIKLDDIVGTIKCDFNAIELITCCGKGFSCDRCRIDF